MRTLEYLRQRNGERGRVKFRRSFAGNVHPRTRGMHNFSLSDRALRSLVACRSDDKKRRAIKAVEVKSRGFQFDCRQWTTKPTKRSQYFEHNEHPPTRFLQNAKRASVLPCRPRNITANCCTLQKIIWRMSCRDSSKSRNFLYACFRSHKMFQRSFFNAIIIFIFCTIEKLTRVYNNIFRPI